MKFYVSKAVLAGTDIIVPKKIMARRDITVAAKLVYSVLLSAQLREQPDPSVREIAKALGGAHSTVAAAIRSLYAIGLVTQGPYERGKSRCRTVITTSL